MIHDPKPALTILSLGGGVQSSTLAEMIVEGDLPPVDYVLFADTGDEPDYVYRQIKYLHGRLASVGVPLETVTAGNMLADAYNASRFANMPVYSLVEKQTGHQIASLETTMLKRQCTADYKIEPVNKFTKARLLEMGLAKRSKNGAMLLNDGVLIEKWLGISLDEVQRVKRSRHKWELTRWPLIEMRISRAACVHYLQSKKLPVPNKSSCRVCPFHSDAHWQDMKDSRPKDWAHVVQFDNDLRNADLAIRAATKGQLFLHRSCVPLSEVTFANEGQLTFDFCGGECFT